MENSGESIGENIGALFAREAKTRQTVEGIEAEVERLRAYVDGNDYHSDYRTATDMRAALGRATRALDVARGYLRKCEHDAGCLREEIAACQRDGDAAIKHFKAGQDFERAAIVKWLRESKTLDVNMPFFRAMANAFEAGEHLKGEQE